ncbi:hypothetical protein EV702DRAFT_1198395 [Suillus placidus]|uniref:Uncharacterized protein n=1 Tax=Suillus placidus TaxID=48579 RepID=A0A9P6ZUF1_9AGAM|nr:hypothetical protein EV702DRAFT_1198395 [Suillus placidus]
MRARNIADILDIHLEGLAVDALADAVNLDKTKTTGVLRVLALRGCFKEGDIHHAPPASFIHIFQELDAGADGLSVVILKRSLVLYLCVHDHKAPDPLLPNFGAGGHPAYQQDKSDFLIMAAQGVKLSYLDALGKIDLLNSYISARLLSTFGDVTPPGKRTESERKSRLIRKPLATHSTPSNGAYRPRESLDQYHGHTEFTAHIILET